MKVNKAHGTSSNKSCASTWLAHWEKLSGQNAYMCFAQDCINTPSVGALIQKDSPTDKNVYVIPLCNDCNKKSGQELDIWDTTKLVPADALTTSGTAVTPRSLAQWASKQFPEGRVLWQPRLRPD